MSVIGHNRPPLDLPDGFEIDYGHVVMDRAFYHPDLKNMIDGDRLLLAAMGFGMRRGCPAIRMSLRYANVLMGESESTTQERFKRLRKLRWLKCIPGRGSRPTEWELDLPPTEFEAAIRNGVEAYNAKLACSVPAYKGATGSSLPTDWGTRRDSLMTDRGTTEWASQSLPGNRGTRRISRPRSAPVDPSWTTGGPVPTKELNRQTVSREVVSGDPGQVVPLRDDPAAMALHREREERFGPGLMSSAQRLASFLQVGCPEALDLMDAHQGSVSPGVVLNAIAKLDLRGLDRNGLPIKDRKTWFEKGIGFARADADGDWLEAPKVARDPRRSQPYDSDVDENAASTKKLDAALALVRKQDGIR